MNPHFTITGFELLERVGEGGMASVWKARQISLDRIVAIKILSDRLAADADDVERFLTESRSAAKLKHPGIVQVYDARAEQGKYFFVMEFVAGYTVGEWVRRKGRLSLKETLLIAECVADALGYAWERERMVHCDIKPDNVMIDEDGTVKVADLGLARTISAMHTAGDRDDIMGTPAYMSPEQALGRPDLDCRSDVYSLGAMLYHLLTGRMLFEGMPPESVLDAQVQDSVPDPLERVPSLGQPVCWMLERMLCKDPESRPQTWEAVVEDIRTVRRGVAPKGSVTGAGTPPASTIRRSARRARLPSALRSARSSFSGKASDTSGRKRWFLMGGAVMVAVILAVYLAARPSPDPAGSGIPSPPAEPLSPAFAQPPSAEPAAADHDGIERSARDMYAYAVAYEREQPSHPEEAIRLYQRVLSETRGTKYSLMAETAIGRLRQVVNAHMRQTLEDLCRRADARVADGQAEQALVLLESYAGPYADETGPARRDKAAEIRARIRAEAAERESRRRMEERARENTLSQLTAHVLDGRFKDAARMCGEPAIASSPEGDALAPMLDAAAAMDSRILESFARQTGLVVTVQFPSGARSVRIDRVNHGRVHCRYMDTDVDFGMDQITLRERLLRMEPDDDPAVALVKGQLAFASDAWDHAERYFARSHPLIADRLVAAVNARRHEQAESEAETALRQFLSALDVAAANLAPDQRMNWARTVAVSPEWAERMDAAVQAYLDRYGQSDAGATARPLLELLQRRARAIRERQNRAAAAPPPPPPDAAPQVRRTHAVIEMLLEQNPKADRKGIRHQEQNGICRQLRILDPHVVRLDAVSSLTGLHDFRYEMRREHNAQLRTLDALAGLPIQTLVVTHTPIRELDALRGMPLVHLNLTGTDVRDLGILRNTDLRELIVSDTAIPDLMTIRTLRSLMRLDAVGTGVNSGTPLDDLPIRHLDLSRSRVIDFRFVRQMPDLRHLAVNGCSIRSIESLMNPSLTSLHMAQTQVEDLSPLRGSQITHLNISGAPVRDYSPLRTLALKQLTASGCSMNALDELTGMPLEHLDVSGTRVASLDPLGGIPSLVSLNLSGTRVKSLQPLQGKSFKMLNIANTPIRDMTPLWGATIEHLVLDNPRAHVDLLRSLKGLRWINGRDVLVLMGN